MQAALQPHVDNAISKTIKVPRDCEFGAFKKLYFEAYRLGMKGCTTFRPNEMTGAILSGQKDQLEFAPDMGGCSLEQESG
jgi:ribonucleoside-diphosphate reductase alpha chain